VNDLANESFITSPVGHVLRAALERVAETVPVTVVYYTDTSETVRIMVESNIGIAILATRVASSATGTEPLRYIPLAESWAAGTFSIIRRQNEQPTPAVRAFQQILGSEAKTVAAEIR